MIMGIGGLMNTQQIEYILTVARLKSFSKAAKELFVTQPSLSQYIMKTEEKLGFTVFDRSSSPITLTPMGKVFVEYAKQFQALEESLNNRISDMQNLKSGSLRIGASSFHASCLLAKSIAQFKKEYSGIEISVAEENDRRLSEMIKNGELDIMISAEKVDTAALHTENLAKERYYLAVPSSHSLNKSLGEFSLDADDIKTQSLKLISTPCISLKQAADCSFIISQAARDFEETILKKEEVSPDTALTVRTVETLFSFVNEGLGLALIPDTVIRFGNFSNHPVYYALNPDISQRSLKLCSRANGYFSTAAHQYSLILKQLVDIGTWRVNR